MSNAIIIKRAKSVFVIVPIYCLCDWILFNQLHTGRLKQELYLQSLVPLLIIGNILLLLWMLREIYEVFVNRPKVVVNLKGIEDRASKERIGFIPWEQIGNIEIVRGLLAAKLTISLNSVGANRAVVIYGLRLSEQQERWINLFHVEAKNKK